jgi:hypothetical protein
LTMTYLLHEEADAAVAAMTRSWWSFLTYLLRLNASLTRRGGSRNGKRKKKDR